MSDIKIIADTKDYVVIDKPAGLLVHGAPHIKEPTLVDWLLQKYPEVGQVGEDLERPGIMHRLDKDVSGLMVIAKNHSSYESLKDQFKNRIITKEYTALVYGQVLKEEDEIDFPIKRSTKGYKMAAVPKNFSEENEDEKVRLAATTFSVIKKFINFTLLKVIIKTGRTHQIRVHLHAYGHPIVGDSLYNNKQSKIKNKKYNLGRVFLASTHLEFNDLNGERQSFSAGLPEDLTTFLTQIK
ncbi:MAG: RNA pseudouridine synthase [Patescibacteria group bacterium]